MKPAYFFILLLLFACNNAKKKIPFALKDLTATVLERNGSDVFQYWEFRNDSFLWEYEMGSIPHIEKYKDSLRMLLGDDSLAAVVKLRAEQDVTFQWDTSNGDRVNTWLVKTKQAGRTVPIRFLEAQLLNYQLGRYPLLSHPTEFHAFILQNDSLNRTRVYFASGDQRWPPQPIVILDTMVTDLQKGWKLRYHLHNHYEPKMDQCLGILAPSLADAQYYKMLAEEYKLEKALITNGFHTVEIEATEFELFRSH